MKDARWLWEANLLEDDYDAKEKTSRLKQTIRTKFRKQLKNEFKEAMFAAFDIFNVNASFNEKQNISKILG